MAKLDNWEKIPASGRAARAEQAEQAGKGGKTATGAAKAKPAAKRVTTPSRSAAREVRAKAASKTAKATLVAPVTPVTPVKVATPKANRAAAKTIRAKAKPAAGTRVDKHAVKKATQPTALAGTKLGRKAAAPVRPPAAKAKAAPDLAVAATPARATSASRTPAVRRGKDMDGVPAPLRPQADRSAGATAAVPPEGFVQDALTSVRIFQIHYQPQQRTMLDPAFEPFDNAGAASPLLEFGVFERLDAAGELDGVPLWGALSWKFGRKTGMTGAEFRERIAANPGHDVYFCNPNADAEALFHNLWLQGETAHPNFMALCREVFAAAGLPQELLTEIQPSAEFASANYFVATPAFWKRYIAFIRRVLAAAEVGLSPTAREILHSSSADQYGMHANATYVPFLVERMFSVFLRTEGSGFRACKIALPERAGGGNAHLKLLGEMKDVAHRTRSLWLAACWVNYRNLYLSKVYGAAWSRKYLKAITPGTIAFAGGAPSAAAQVACAASAGAQ